MSSYVYSKGLVIVLELHLEKRGKPDRLRVTNDHKGRLITALQWSQDGRQVFVGDDHGLVTAVNASSKVLMLYKQHMNTVHTVQF